MILTDQSQLKNLDNVGAVLIYLDKSNTTDLINSAADSNLTVNAIVSNGTADIDTKKLSEAGYPDGCFVVFQYADKQDSEKLTNSFSNLLQLGYRVGIIINVKDYSDDDLKLFNQHSIVVVDQNSISNNLMTVSELVTSRSLEMVRDYTNVNYEPSNGAYVGLGRDTSGLQGGPAFGYSTNGKDFYAVITPKGIIPRQADAERMWRLLKPKQREDIDIVVGDTVAKEVKAATSELPDIRDKADEAIKNAESAINASKLASDTVAAQSSAINEAKSAADSAVSEINQLRADASKIDQSMQQVSAQQKVMSDQITQKVSSVDYQKDKTDFKNSIAKNATAINENANQISLKANQTDVDNLKGTAQQLNGQLNVLSEEITSKVSKTDVDGIINGKGFITQATVQSLIDQKADTISESITKADNKITDDANQIQTITLSLDGLKSTVKNKADQSSIIQLNNLIQTKVNSDDFNSSITQLKDSVSARVSKGDLISQINLEAGRALFQSKKIFLDADSVVFSENSKTFIPNAAITNLSLDKLTAGHLLIPLADKLGNQIEMGNGGIEISSYSEELSTKTSDDKKSDSDNPTVKSTAASPIVSLAAIDDQPGDSENSSASSGSSTGIPDQPDNPDHPDTYTKAYSYRMRITADGLRMVQHVHYKNDRTNEESDRNFTQLHIAPVNPVGTETLENPSGLAFITNVDEIDKTAGGNQPASFLALGHGNGNGEEKTTVDVVYSPSDKSGYPAGLNINTRLHMMPPGADHGMRTVWVSWSAWDNGEKYPAIVNDTSNWGGICFPKSGVPTIFDAYGKYSIPDKNTGHGPYNGYGG